MKLIASITFKEAETGEECVAIVRAASGSIAIALSRRSDADVEVVLPAIQARELSRALSAALAEAERPAE